MFTSIGDTNLEVRYEFGRDLNNIEIIYLIKEWPSEKSRFILRTNVDTLMYYRTRINDSTKMLVEFYRGKYYYDSKTLNLNEGQVEYFIEHWDSLIRIEGTDLPELPELPFDYDSIEERPIESF
jgi:hypothetical protein